MRPRTFPVPAVVPAAAVVVALLPSPSPLLAVDRLASVRPVPTPALSARASVADVRNAYDQTQKSVEAQFAKLIQDAKGEIRALQDKIAEIGRQISTLKDRIKKIELVESKIEALLPQVVGSVGSDRGGGFAPAPRGGSAKSSHLAAFLTSELSRAGIAMAPDTLSGIVQTIVKGGQAGMAAAVGVVMQIAEASVPGFRSLRGPPEFPKMPPAQDVQTSVALGGPGASAYLAGIFASQAMPEIKRLNDTIDTLRTLEKSARKQIATLELEIEQLEKAREKALADLAKQKAAALLLATRNLATPTPGRR